MEDKERRRPFAGSDEGAQEGSGDDTELHRRKQVAQNEEAAQEGESDDDVELHRRSVQ